MNGGDLLKRLDGWMAGGGARVQLRELLGKLTQLR